MRHEIVYMLEYMILFVGVSKETSPLARGTEDNSKNESAARFPDALRIISYALSAVMSPPAIVSILKYEHFNMLFPFPSKYHLPDLNRASQA